MIFDWLNSGSAYFWLFWSGLFLGASINRATSFRVRGDRWSGVFLYLSFAAAAVTCAMVLPGHVETADRTARAMTEDLLAPRSADFLWGRVPFASESVEIITFTACVALLSFLATRYPLPAGVPIVAALAVLVLWTGFTLQGMRPVRAAGVVGVARALAVGQGRMTLELDGPSGVAAAARSATRSGSIDALSIGHSMLGSEAVAVVDVSVVPSWCFLFPTSRFYRIVGLVAPRAAFGAHDRSRPIAVLRGRPLFLPSSPLAASGREVSAPFRPHLLESYGIVLGEDSVVHIEPMILNR